jgi:hypothetical protein
MTSWMVDSANKAFKMAVQLAECNGYIIHVNSEYTFSFDHGVWKVLNTKIRDPITYLETNKTRVTHIALESPMWISRVDIYRASQSGTVSFGSFN